MATSSKYLKYNERYAKSVFMICTKIIKYHKTLIFVHDVPNISF